MSLGVTLPAVRHVLAAVALLTAFLLLAIAALLAPAPARAQASASDDVERGAYLARVGDCTACHTAPGARKWPADCP
jgi:alcohol dehydrogenase (quinone), cytochrome c subunit